MNQRFIIASVAFASLLCAAGASQAAMGCHAGDINVAARFSCR